MLNEEKQPDDTSEDRVVFETRVFDIVERLQTGQSGKRHIRYVVRNRGAVAILPILPDGRLVLIKQYRAPAQRYIYEIPAGSREIGEDPLVTATRELTEETGYKAGKIEKMMSFYSSPGIFQERLHLYIATELQEGQSELEEGEDIDVHLVTLEEAKEMMMRGEIDDAKTILAILSLFAPFSLRVS